MSSRQIRLKPATSVRNKHPWKSLDDFESLALLPEDGASVEVFDAEGASCGAGVFDRNDPIAVWRRFSRAEGALFDEAYLAIAIPEAIERRGFEPCQRLVSSDADFIPGLVVELFNDVAVVSIQSTAVRAHRDFILEMLKETLDVAEVVIEDEGNRVTMSGNNLKARWIEVDELGYRVDFLRSDKPRFPLGLREQYVLFGSLCEGRRVLDLNANSGGFAMQAMIQGAASALAVDPKESFAKAIGANSQKNGLHVDVRTSGAVDFLGAQTANAFDAVVLSFSDSEVAHFRQASAAALKMLPERGLIAVYNQGVGVANCGLEQSLAEAAETAGREARVFARTAQPFDFPMMLNFPESQVLEGLILEVL